METEQLYRLLKVADEYCNLATAEIKKVRKDNRSLTLHSDGWFDAVIKDLEKTKEDIHHLSETQLVGSSEESESYKEHNKRVGVKNDK